MLSFAQKELIFNRIPNIICGDTLFKYSGENYVNPPAYPTIWVKFQSEGVRTDFFSDQLSHIYSPDLRSVEVRKGNLQKATIQLVLISDSEAKMRNYVYELSQWLWQYKLFLSWNTHKMQVRDIEPVTELPPQESLYRKGFIYHSVIDIFIKYEFSWVEVAPTITAFDITMTDFKGGVGFHMMANAPYLYQATIGIKKQLSCGLGASIKLI